MPNPDRNRKMLVSGSYGSSSPSVPVNTLIGTIVSNDFAGSFTTKGTSGSTVNVSSITFSSAGPNFNFDNGIWYNDFITLSEGMILRSTFRIDNKGTSSGFSPQLVTVNGTAMYSCLFSVSAGFLGDGYMAIY